MRINYPFADPHPEGVTHPNEAEDEEDVDGLEEVAVELEVQGRRKKNGANEFTLRSHETCEEKLFIKIFFTLCDIL